MKLRENEEFYNGLNNDELERILGKAPTKLYYKFNDYTYNTQSKNNGKIIQSDIFLLIS